MYFEDRVIGRRDQSGCVLRAANRDSLMDGGVHLDKFIIVAGRIKFAADLFFMLPGLGLESISWNRVFPGSVSTQCGFKLKRAPA